MLEVADLHVSLGSRPVLRGLSLQARPGEVLAICGANGAGKSTLLRAVLGEVPLRGFIQINGVDATACHTTDLARLRGVLPQSTEVAFAFTLGEIVAMGQEAGDFAAETGLVHKAPHAVGLAGRETEDFRSLSGGERQRGHLARVLAQVWQPVGPGGPRWLLLDEPVASLDLGHQLAVMRLVRSYADAGGGVVAVMHDLNLSAMFADRMAFLIGGEIAACGRPSVVLSPDLLARAYGCPVTVNAIPVSGPWLLPNAAADAAIPGSRC